MARTRAVFGVMVLIKECVLCSRNQDGMIYAGENWRVIVVDEAGYPGFCRVIWNRHVAEMTDLDENDRMELMSVVWLVERCVRQVMQPDKINLASLGNMVPHLHWHVIPRYADDAHFPDSVWSVARRCADERAIRERKSRLPELRKRLEEVLTAQYGPARGL